MLEDDIIMEVKGALLNFFFEVYIYTEQIQHLSDEDERLARLFQSILERDLPRFKAAQQVFPTCVIYPCFFCGFCIPKRGKSMWSCQTQSCHPFYQRYQDWEAKGGSQSLGPVEVSYFLDRINCS